ncbi:MAG: T9SS type A sorting domain-containing protein [Bacteroidetes bacterium]|nr:T9SS type A sorting domain-containing protein [Bacteroidota bacterium]
MKKHLLLRSFSLFVFFVLFRFSVIAQYTKLLDFAGATNGQSPYGALYSDGTFLYGMTSAGGTTGDGVIFKIQPDGTGYSKLLDFNATTENTPYGSLISDGTFLYGMIAFGGTFGYGVIFKIKPDGTGYAILHNFGSGSDGSSPHGSLIYDGTYLYGMTNAGGGNNYGTVFKIKPNGIGYADLLDFNATNGQAPFGSLVSDGTFLYGMTAKGGANNLGVLFKIMPNGTGYADLIDFNGAFYGSYPTGDLMYDGTYLYGMAQNGGANGYGTIFKIMPNGTGYTKLLDFSNIANGSNPNGSLITDGFYLYGMTYQGGTYGAGVLFKVYFNGSGYTKLMDFDGASNGNNPYGSVIFGGGILYGMTSSGGINSDGTVFKYDPISISAVMTGNPICSNQCTGSASTSVLNGTPPYTYLWSSGETTSTATGLCAGTNTVTVSDGIGGSASDIVTITSLPQPTAPSICAVTVDSLSQYNIVLWDKTPFAGGGVDSFIVYREITTNNYQIVGAVPFDSLSMFVDTVFAKYFPYTGDPNKGTYRYKLVARDTCGNYSAMSNYHNTIYTTNNSGTFSWNFYAIENTANPVTGYILRRDDLSNGNWKTVAGVSGTQQTVTDPNYSSYPNGSWRVETQWSISCTPTIKNPVPNATNLNTSRSNIYKTNNPNAVSQIDFASQLIIYPNPSSGIFQIQVGSGQSATGNEYKIEIYNVFGEKMTQSVIPSGARNLSIDLSNQPKGIYFMKVQSESKIYTEKVVIQ